MLTPAVSVVIPTYNRLDLLRDTVQSVRSQDCGWELIVVDDASTDGTKEWIESLDDPRVRLSWQAERVERAAGRNRGLELVESELVMFLDHDDLLAPGALKALSDAVHARRNVVGAIGAVQTFDENGNRHRMPHPRRARILDAWRDLILGWTPPPGAAVLRTDVVRRVGGFPTDFVTVDDQAVFIKVAAEGSLAFVPNIVLHHRMHSAQVRTHIHSELHDGVRNAYVETLSGDRRARAASAIAMRQLEGEGWFAWRRNDRAAALRSYVRAALLDPTTLWSPLVGPRYWSLILRCVVGVIVGARATALLQRGVWTARRRLKRLPGFVESPLPFRPDAPTPYDPRDGARPGGDPAGDQ